MASVFESSLRESGVRSSSSSFWLVRTPMSAVSSTFSMSSTIVGSISRRPAKSFPQTRDEPRRSVSCARPGARAAACCVCRAGAVDGGLSTRHRRRGKREHLRRADRRWPRRRRQWARSGLRAWWRWSRPRRGRGGRLGARGMSALRSGVARLGSLIWLVSRWRGAVAAARQLTGTSLTGFLYLPAPGRSCAAHDQKTEGARPPDAPRDGEQLIELGGTEAEARIHWGSDTSTKRRQTWTGEAAADGACVEPTPSLTSRKSCVPGEVAGAYLQAPGPGVNGDVTVTIHLT